MLSVCELLDQIQFPLYCPFLVQQFQNIQPIILVHHIIPDQFHLLHKPISLLNYFFEPLLSIHPFHQSINIVLLSEPILFWIIGFIQIAIDMITYLNRTLIKLIPVLQLGYFDTEIYYSIIFFKVLNILIIILFLTILLDHLHLIRVPHNNKYLQILLLFFHLSQHLKPILYLLLAFALNFMIINMNN